MSLHYLPLTAEPDAEQSYTLEGLNYALRTRWNERASAWFLDLASEDGTALVTGRKIVIGWVTGTREASPYPQGSIFAFDTSGADLDPTETDLGARVLLFYMDSTGPDA